MRRLSDSSDNIALADAITAQYTGVTRTQLLMDGIGEVRCNACWAAVRDKLVVVAARALRFELDARPRAR